MSALLCLVVFGSGMIFGAGLTVVTINRHVRRVVHHPELAVKGFMRVMARRLDLDDGQKQQIRAILAKRQAVLQRLRTRYQPQVEVQLAQLVTEIDTVLRPGQKKKFRAMVARMHRLKPPLPSGTDQRQGRASSRGDKGSPDQLD